VILFASGFAETGPEGARLEAEVSASASAAGTRVLGPNSAGVIRPGTGLAASFLTCLDRPAGQIRSGPVGVVTQSGGTGSYIHNLAAARGEGIAISISTGNEADIKLGEAVDAISRLQQVAVILAVVETVRDGAVFVEAVRSAHSRQKRVVVCRIGSGARGGALIASHTGALAVPEAILTGVFASLGVVVAETPAEAYDVAMILARTKQPKGNRAGVVTHSGGMAVLLSDLADKAGLALEDPSPKLTDAVGQLLDHGAANNPLDMGGIIGGPTRFAEVVDRFAGSGEYDVVLAVSTAHPPAHTATRVESLLDLAGDVPMLHLWMAGDQASHGLAELRRANRPVTEEPRAAIRALAGLTAIYDQEEIPEPLPGPPETWGIPLHSGFIATTESEAVAAADALGYPVVVKLEHSGLAHKTDVGGVLLDLRSRAEVEEACDTLTHVSAENDWTDFALRVQRYRPGLETIVGAIRHDSFGPMVSVGFGGVHTEVDPDVVFAPAPVGVGGARSMIDRIRGRGLLDGVRGGPPADIAELARLVSLVSRGIAGKAIGGFEINPLIWDGGEWVAVDWLLA
jgi:acyl-CoA synthetase (NDP forming)